MFWYKFCWNSPTGSREEMKMRKVKRQTDDQKTDDQKISAETRLLATVVMGC